jgi:multidrug resistance efflux pump
MTVERPCTVNAYFTDELMARASGQINWISVDRGSAVEKGQQIVNIDVPDRVAEMKQKHEVIGQREKEYQLAEQKIRAAEAMVHTAEANIKEREALVLTAQAAEKYRVADFNRLFELRKTNSVDQNVVDVALRAREAATAEVFSTRAAVLKAQSQLEDAKANLEVAKAERDEKYKLIDVATAEFEKAKALREFAVVRAPYNANVADRYVGPGTTVQDATQGHPTSMLKLQRVDIVTVSMQLPDKYTNFVKPGTDGTDAVMTFDSLPGLKIQGKVTRTNKSLTSASHDKTMRIEVDLWNRSAEDYQKMMANRKFRADLKPGPPPLVPVFAGKNPLQRSTELKPGDYGNMTLVLRTFANTYLIPSQALLREGGRTMIYVVKNGKAHLLPVDVQVDDGVLAKVERLDDKDNVVGDLTGTEEVVISNQEELSEGQPVKPTLKEHWTAKDVKKAH